MRAIPGENMVRDFFLWLLIFLFLLLIMFLRILLVLEWISKVESNKGQILCGTFFDGALMLLVLGQPSCFGTGRLHNNQTRGIGKCLLLNVEASLSVVNQYYGGNAPQGMQLCVVAYTSGVVQAGEDRGWMSSPLFGGIIKRGVLYWLTSWYQSSLLELHLPMLKSLTTLIPVHR